MNASLSLLLPFFFFFFFFFHQTKHLLFLLVVVLHWHLINLCYWFSFFFFSFFFFFFFLYTNAYMCCSFMLWCYIDIFIFYFQWFHWNFMVDYHTRLFMVISCLDYFARIPKMWKWGKNNKQNQTFEKINWP